MDNHIEINAMTNEITQRALNERELEQREIDRIGFLVEEEQKTAALVSKSAARLSLLDRLGITVEEAELLK